MMAQQASQPPPTPAACPHGDPTCPCPDGDVCHYEDDPGNPNADGRKAEPCEHCGTAQRPTDGSGTPVATDSAGGVLAALLGGIAAAKRRRARRHG